MLLGRTLLPLLLLSLFGLLVACGSEATPPPTAPVVPVATTTATKVAATNVAATESPATSSAATATLTVAEMGTAFAVTETAAVQDLPAGPEETAQATATTVPATPTPVTAAVSAIRLAPLARGLDQPTFLTHAGDTRLFVTEQPGRIRIVVGGEVLANPFLDISDQVGSQGSEQGLLSVAFHPHYSVNGTFYVDYTDNNGDTVISRFRVSGDQNRADPASETVLLTVAQPYGNHNGGQLQFGPDGYLYIGMGDGGSGGDPQGNGQNPATLLGALLRIDVDNAPGGVPYAAPADNPYAGSDAGRNEIWAIGLRNPWRFSFDRLTGDLYVADVGQNQYEEVNFVPAGQGTGVNYGWNVMEGLHCFNSATCDQAGLLLPVVEYSHSEGGCSISGGYVYRGSEFPALTGNYFFGDYCSGRIWALYGDGDDWSFTQVARSDENITSFGQGADGSLYLVTQQGSVYKIRP